VRDVPDPPDLAAQYGRPDLLPQIEQIVRTARAKYFSAAAANRAAILEEIFAKVDRLAQ
jgi:hypothetical protein